MCWAGGPVLCPDPGETAGGPPVRSKGAQVLISRAGLEPAAPHPRDTPSPGFAGASLGDSRDWELL